MPLSLSGVSRVRASISGKTCIHAVDKLATRLRGGTVAGARFRHLMTSPTIRWFLCAGFAVVAGARVVTAADIVYTEVARKEVRLGDHTVTLIRVRPPALPKVTCAPAAAPRPLTAEEKAYEERMAKKAYATLGLSATVYLGGPAPVTGLRWRNESGDIEYRAWSNVDFRYLTQLTQLETDSTVYSWFPFVSDCELAGMPDDEKSLLPTGLNFSRTEAEYVVEAHAGGLRGEETTLAGLDYLHAYYQLNYADLKADYEKREALNAAEAEKLRKNPPCTPDATLRFWQVKSRLHSR
jgi:hypothetical protein